MDKVEGTELQEVDFIFKYRKNGENVLNRKTLICNLILSYTDKEGGKMQLLL